MRKALFSALALLLFAAAAHAQPTLSKVFTPSTIGPGSVSTITFTIINGSASPVSDLAFTDVLPLAPGPMTIADPSNASTTCDLGTSGSLSAPDGGSTIALSGAQIGGSQSCTITIDVTAGTPGVHTNPAITLTSSAGSSMSLPVDLTVTTTLPSFSKSFAPSSISLGERSTLTFTIDNALNPLRVGNLDFTDDLPSGMVVADPSNAFTDCISGSFPDTTVTAVPGTGVIILNADGSTLFPGFEVLPAGVACTVSVDVVGTGIGMLDNVTNDLLADFTSAGKASDTLAVSVTPIAITKAFTDDPTPPGDTATLEFTLINFDRTASATDLGFTDDLGTLVPALPGLVFTSELANDCGTPVTGVGSTVLALTGATLAPEATCTIRVELDVPPGAIPGPYVNTTSAVSATVDGSPVVGNMASDALHVEPIPLLTKEFLEAGTLLPDPIVDPGDDVILRFTVTNTSTTSMATDVAFLDELTDGGPGTGFLPFPLSVILPPTPCGAGSALAFTFPDIDRQAISLTGGTLDPAPGPGSTCSFDITVSIPSPFPPGVYLNTTGAPTATVDGATRTGRPASDSLTVISAPILTKVFDDPVAPGDTVTLEFTLTYPADASGDATDIGFTDDLAALVPPLAGLTATGLPLMEACDPDGPGGDPGTGTLSGSAGDTLLTLMGATLSPGESCTISVDLAVPMGAAPGNYTNTTSGVSATVEGLPAISAPASDVLNVAGLVFSKEFLGDPAIPGETVTLRFTIGNIHPTDDATITFFTDTLSATLPGLAATGPPTVNTCGGTLSGTTSLVYVGGSVMSGMSCNIEVPVLVPLGAADGSYLNVTGSLSAVQSGGGIAIDPATDFLEVNSTLIQLDKAFTDDPVAPGDSVTLDFTLTNLDPDGGISDIDFTDDLTTALPGLTFDSVLLDTCGGMVTGETTTMITVTGASLTAGGFCTLRVSLSVPGGTAAGLYVNETSGLTGDLGGFAVSGDPASGELEVVQLLDFSKSFDGPTTATGTATLSFTITNPGAETADEVNFFDDLSSVIPGLIAISLPALPCGPDSSITGISFLAFENGELAPMGGTCSFDVVVQVPAGVMAGAYLNATSELTRAGLVVADPAMADLEIEPPPTFAKVFDPDTIFAAGVSTLRFTIDNSDSALAADDLEFTDTLPAGVVITSPAVTSNTCGGTLTAIAGSGSIDLTAGSVGAGTNCAIEVDVTSIVSGMHVNLTGDLTSTSGNSGTATDTLTVVPSADVSVTKTDGVTTATPGGSVTYTIVVSNAGPSDDPSVTVADTFPAALTCTYTSVAAGGATGNTAAGAGDLSDTLSMPTGSSVTYTASCTIASGATGTLSNTASITPSINDPVPGNNSATDGDTVLVPETDLSITKSDSPDPTIAGQTITYTLVVTNNGPSDSTGSTITDGLPAGVSFASSADCVEAAGTVSCAIGALAPAASQMASFVVNVDSGPSTVISNTATVAANEGDPDSGNNSATEETTVNTQPGFSKAFDPNPLPAGDTAVLTFTIDNSTSTVAATALDFTDNLPADVVIASPANDSTTCTGGTLTAVAGTGTITYTGGTVAAMGSCTVSVDVTSSVPGMYENVTGDLTSSLGNSGTASATLDVTDEGPPEVIALLTDAGPLAECDTVTLPISTLRLGIEDGNTPVLGADDPAAYLLVGTGPDGDFSTVDCSGSVAGDDVAVPITDLGIDDGDPLLVEVTLAVGETGGLYRFSVCDSITDGAGNALDGDGDGTPGGDFVLSFFRADPLNLFANGHFDDCPVSLAPWVTAATPPNAVQPGTPGTDDVDSSPLSASAQIAHSTDEASSLGQCVPVASGVTYAFEASLRFDPPMGALATFSRTCEFFDAALCGGASLGSSSTFSLVEDEGGVWLTSSEEVMAPAGAVSALCQLGIAPLGDDPNFDIFLDALFLGAEGAIFSDGFESGDTSAWSSTNP